MFWSAIWRWLNRVGAIIGIAGFGFAIYAYLNSLPLRRLTFYEDPASALIVKAGQTSKLLITYEDKPIFVDVVAAQIALWNAGKLSIKPEHIREPIVIRTEPPCPILEPTIRASTPEREKIINVRIDKTEASLGKLTLSWDLLEQDDGFQLQLIFAGPTDTRLIPSGVLEGQKHIAILSLEKTDRFIKWTFRSLIGLVLGLIIVSLICLAFPWGRSAKTPPPRWYTSLYREVFLLAIILSACCLLRALALQFGSRALMPESLITPGLRQELQKQNGSSARP